MKSLHAFISENLDQKKVMPKLIKDLDGKLKWKSGKKINIHSDNGGKRTFVDIEGKVEYTKKIPDGDTLWKTIRDVGKRHGSRGTPESATYHGDGTVTVRISYVYGI